MNAPRCARLWQVEAVKDQRLSGADRVAFERHLETCSECTSELAALERLEALGARLPAPASDPLARRRLRNDILRRANELSVGTGRPPPRRRHVVLGATALAAAALLVTVVALRRDDGRGLAANVSVGEPRFEIVTAPGSEWSTLKSGPALRLSLRRGQADVTVQKLRAGQSFVLELPDGELEVRGTRFSVQVADRKTRSVKVSEGLVALRLREGTGRELLLGAGQGWVMTLAPAPRAPEPQKALAVAPSASGPAATSPAKPVSPAPASKPASASGATEEFAAAMAAYSRGDFATAERLFLAFEAHYPTSGHVEDTTFLRALTRLRRGDEAGGKALAREYLKRYPNGFRAPEAERLAR
jgi:ferric-dicitrate binding protein FerR (iron transport regulator)